VKRVLDEAGPIDALVHLAGGFAGGRVEETTDETWRHMMDLNLTAAFLMSRAVLPHMRTRGSGRIICVGSRAAENPFPGAAAYIASKAGLSALVRALALELSGTGVTVNALLPTTIDTPANRKSMPDADRSLWIAPTDLARTILFLASDEARGLSGALIPVG
jgi:NAD(P)-dependent dehydrogenase (short-subunit alcohol dehydrogenase family)